MGMYDSSSDELVEAVGKVADESITSDYKF